MVRYFVVKPNKVRDISDSSAIQTQELKSTEMQGHDDGIVCQHFRIGPLYVYVNHKRGLYIIAAGLYEYCHYALISPEPDFATPKTNWMSYARIYRKCVSSFMCF